MFENMAHACDELVKKDLPIIFIDTCVYLNFLNSFYQPNLSDQYARACMELMHSHGRTCSMITCDVVQDEFYRNIEVVTENLRKEISKSHATINNILGFINEVHSSTLSIPKEELLHPRVTGLIKKTVFGFIGIGGIVPHSDEHLTKAMLRIMKSEAPSRRGKAEPGDCLIIATFLNLSNELRIRGFKKDIFFITYNKDDFGRAGALKPPLDEEFNSIQAQFSSDICHLAYLMR
ncbi:PIN domain-containing protein [Aeromonas veronii]|nr:PIN domain-containing protein [Aeromonas veronii]